MKPDKTFTYGENTHVGDRVFLLGTGPSLTAHQVRLLRHEYTIAGGSYPLWAEMPFPPDAYTVNEEVTFVDCHHQAEQFPESTQLFVTLPETREHFPTGPGRPKRFDGVYYPMLVPSSRWRVFSHSHAENMSNVGFQMNLQKGRVSWSYSCSGFMLPLQMAFSMGFTAVYLLGYDFTNQGYCYDLKSQESRGLLMQDLAQALDTISRYVAWRDRLSPGLTFCNCSAPNPNISWPPYVPLEEVLGLSIPAMPPQTQEFGVEPTLLPRGGVEFWGFRDAYRVNVEVRCPRTHEVLARYQADAHSGDQEPWEKWYSKLQLPRAKEAVLV